MMSKSRIPSPARSQGAPVTPRRSKPRRTLSMTSAKSDASGRLTSVVEQYINDDKFKMSPLRRKSVLPDDTDIDIPRRASWWKRLDGSSRDVLEALDTNRLPDELLLEDYEFEVQKDKQNQSVPESSDNESVASIIVPQRRLFNQKKQPQGKFGDIMASRKSLGKTTLEDQDKTIHSVPKNLFKQGQPRDRPVFPAALLNSTNKTINKTVDPEPESNKQGRNLFGQAGTRKKSMFTDFVLSESEDDSEVQQKVFGFKKNDKRASLATRNRRMPSLTPSVTTDIDIDDWNLLLPSSTMIGNGSIAMEVSRVITDKDIELAQNENQDVTLTESETKTVEKTQDDDQDATLTEASEQFKLESFTSENPKRQTLNRTRLSKSRKLSDEHNKTLGNEKVLESTTKEQAPSTKVAMTLPETNDSVKSDSVSRNSSENPKRQTLIRSRLSKSRKLSEDNNKILDKNNFESETTEQAPSDERDLMLPEANVSLNSESVKRNTRENSKRQTLNRSGLSKSNKTHGNENILESETTKYAQVDNQDLSIPETNESLKLESNKQNDGKILKKLSLNRTEQNKSKKLSEVNKTFADEDNIEPVPLERTRDDNQLVAQEANKSSKPESDKQSLDQTGLSKSRKLSNEYNKTLADGKVLHSKTPEEAHDHNQDVNEQTTVCEPSVEDQMAELHSKSGNNNKSEETEQSVDQRSEISAKDRSKEESNKDMEEMVWDEDDEENKNNTSQEESEEEEDEDEVENDQDNDEDVEDDQDDEDVENDQKDNEQEVSDQVTPTKDIPNKSQKIVESSIEEEQIDQENEAIDGTPNVTYDTTGRNRIKDVTQVKSPESVLKNMSRDNMSFKPIGRSTSFRKSRSPTENRISRPTLIPIQETIIGSDGSRNSSTEGSGWDSHRTTRKTLRQTFGKDFTPRKSLRTLVMEKSAKRQTDVIKNRSKINRTQNKTVLEEAGKKTTRVNETANKTVLEDIRDRRVSNRNLSRDQLPSPKSPAPGVSAHHVSDPNISKPQISYHKSVHEINELGTSPQISDRLEPSQAIDDSGPEISIHASYGHGMSEDASDQDDDHSSVKNPQKNSEQRKSVKKSMPLDIDHDMQEALDYEPSLQDDTKHQEFGKEISDRDNSDHKASALEASETEVQDVSDHEENGHSELDESVQDMEAEESTREEDVQESEPEIEHEESQKLSEPESEHEDSEEERESEQEEQEQSQQELEPESEREDLEDSQEEIEPESEREDHEDSQQEIDPESEREEHEDSQQDIEPESEDEEQDASQQEIEEVSAREQSHGSDHDNSEHQSDQESDREVDTDNEQDDGISDNDHVDADEVEREQNPKRFTELVVFDNEISDQEIDCDISERVSRQMTDNDISEQVSDVEIEDQSESRSSVHDNHDVSVGTKKSLLLMQMQKIREENMKIRQEIRENVESSLKRKRDFNPLMSPMQPRIFSTMRRMNKPEPKKPKIQPRETTTVTIGTLPKEFVDDLKYKPPKRFQPANAPWITKRLYKFLETKLEPKYDYRARIRAEELVQSLYGFTKQARRRDVAPQDAVDELKREMARLNVVNTHFDFYEFFHEFMPREIRIKVNPDVVNKIPMPRNGIFADILHRTASSTLN